MFRSLTTLTALTLALTACGGGGGAAGALVLLSSDTAQGWAADAQAMPVSAGTTAQTATRALEAALADGAAAARPQGVAALDATLTLPCASGGTVMFSVSGGLPALHLNGRMDAGEVYDVTFSHCGGPTPGAVLDGSLTLSVIAYSSTSADIDHVARALRLTTAQGSYTLDGNLREQRSTVALAGGGQRLDSHLTSGGLALQSQISGRTSSYELRQLDWTVACTLDTSQMLVARAHQGSLSLVVRSLRRPVATLQVTTQGTLTIGSDGMASQGSFSIATSDDRISVTYGDGGVSVALDLGNNGSIDRRWTLTRLVFIAEVG